MEGNAEYRRAGIVGWIREVCPPCTPFRRAPIPLSKPFRDFGVRAPGFGVRFESGTTAPGLEGNPDYRRAGTVSWIREVLYEKGIELELSGNENSTHIL